MPEHFVPLDIAVKLALSLGVGLLIGLEREWSRKDPGARTFALTALLGTIGSLVSEGFALGCLGAVALLILVVNGRALVLRQSLEITTSISLVVNFVLGVLIGMGHLFTPIAAAALLTAHGEAAPQIAGIATVLASIASAISNLPVIYRVTGNQRITRALALKTVAVAAIGVAAFLAQLLLRR
jgi:uncharacterized membrane protein (DUF4010 family)